MVDNRDRDSFSIYRQLQLLNDDPVWFKKHHPRKFRIALFLTVSVITALALLITLILQLAK